MVALGLALLFNHYGFQQIAFQLFVLDIVLVGWYAGPGASALAVVLSATAYNYYFTAPLYTFAISGEDIPDFLLFVAWSAVVAWFVTLRRKIEDDLRETGERLRHELEEGQRREDRIRGLNHDLTRQAAELTASNAELDAFAYSVSHDLRAPLRHSSGYAELLLKHSASSLDDKARRYVQTILDASKRMGLLIDDLLAFSRIGRAETRMSLVNLNQLAQEAVGEIAEQTQGRVIAWDIGPLAICYGDRSMLRLVITNLVSNAVKFTRAQPQARIEIGCTDIDADHVEVFVRDNGAGFDMKYVNQLFGVFQRLHLREEFEGTGIGLAIVQRVVHRHGGKVRAEGVVGQGATFYFSLATSRTAMERSVQRA